MARDPRTPLYTPPTDPSDVSEDALTLASTAPAVERAIVLGLVAIERRLASIEQTIRTGGAPR